MFCMKKPIVTTKPLSLWYKKVLSQIWLCIFSKTKSLIITPSCQFIAPTVHDKSQLNETRQMQFLLTMSKVLKLWFVGLY